MESGAGREEGKKSRHTNPSKRPVRPEEYEVALRAYLAEPTQAAVQRALGCGPDVARSLVYEGLPRVGLKPLEERRKEESRLVAAGQRRVQGAVERSAAEVAGQLETLAKEAAAVGVARRQAALGDEVAQLEEEAKLVAANRQGAQRLAQTNARLLRVADTLAGAMEKKLEKAATEATRGEELDPDAFFEKAGLTMMQGLGIIRTIANVGQRIAESSKQSVEMARLLSGDPTQVIKVQGDGEKMSPEQAQGWLKRAATAYQRMQDRAKAVDAIVEEQAQLAAGGGEDFDLEQLEDEEEPA